MMRILWNKKTRYPDLAPPSRKMAFNNIELFSAIVLPRLAGRPKTLAQLQVPAYATARLEAVGLVKGRMFSLGPSVAVKVYFLPEDLALLDEETRPILSLPRKHCWELSADDWPPED